MHQAHASTTAHHSTAKPKPQHEKRPGEKKASPNPFKDSISLSTGFQWTKKEGDVSLTSTHKPSFFTSVITPGYKIDHSNKINEFKSAYTKFFLQARSPNLILSRYAAFKASVAKLILSIAGMSHSEIVDMQKKAIAQGIEENKIQFEENEYNAEIAEILQPKKKKKKQNLFDKVRSELILNMEKLGQADYYTPQRIIQIKLTQVVKIQHGFSQEQQQLRYTKEFYYGDT